MNIDQMLPFFADATAAPVAANPIALDNHLKVLHLLEANPR